MKNISILVVCLAIGIIPIFILLFFLPQKKVALDNGFNRNFISSPLSNEKSLDLKYNSYYLAGINQNEIYLGNFHVQDFLLKTDYFLNDTQRIDLDIPFHSSDENKRFKTLVDSSSVFIYENQTPAIMLGTFPSLDYLQPNLEGHWFSTAIPLGVSSMVVSSYDTAYKQTVIRNISYDHLDNSPTYLLERQVDGVFCVDGILLYNKDLKQILYVYFYRNQFVGLNSAMNVLYKGNTIDTLSNPDIQVTTIKSEHRRTLINQPTIVNKRAATYDNLLFIQSGLKADNEAVEDFKNNDVIDLYLLDDQSYLASFYIPKFKKERMHQFKVIEGKIVLIYGHYLVTYDLSMDLMALSDKHTRSSNNG